MESGGKRTPAPHVNAEYVKHVNPKAVPTVYTPHQHMHRVLNPLIFTHREVDLISMLLSEDRPSIRSFSV